MYHPSLDSEEEDQLRMIEKELIKRLKPNLNRRDNNGSKKEKGKRKRPPKCKRDKVNNQKKKDKTDMFWSWQDGEKEFISFDKVIEKIRTPISWQKGGIDMTNWKEIEENYHIEVYTEQDYEDLTFLRKKMKGKRNGFLK